VTSIATIGLYIAYIIPTLLRRLAGDDFKPGPWHLGRWSPLVGWIGVAWVVVITILFMLPEVSPITRDTFNYAPIAVGVVLLFAGGYWFLGANKWFKGPRSQGTEAELEAIERSLSTAEQLESTF
jgi:amino acid transporter